MGVIIDRKPEIQYYNFYISLNDYKPSGYINYSTSYEANLSWN